MAMRIVSFRIPHETDKHLAELCRAFGMTEKDFLCVKIEQEYDELQGKPETKKMLDAVANFREALQEAFEDFGKQNGDSL